MTVVLAPYRLSRWLVAAIWFGRTRRAWRTLAETLPALNELQLQLEGKRLHLPRDTVPTISRVAVIWDSNFGPFHMKELTAAGQALSVQLLPVESGDTPRHVIDRVFAAMAR